LNGLGSFHRLLVIPLLLAQIRNSEGGVKVVLGFLVSETVLLATSLVHAALWDIVPWRIGTFAGVPFKNYITQSELFEISGFALLGLVVDAWRRGRRGQASCLALLAATFFFDILYVATGRTALVAMLVLLIVFGFWHFGMKGVLGALAAGVLLAAVTWASSPYLRGRVSHAVEEVQGYLASRAPTSAGLRLEWWRKSVGFIEQAPIFGNGTGSIDALYRSSQTNDGTAAAIPAENPHQQILAVAIQLGLVGTALLIAMWMAHLALFWRSGLAAWMGFALVVQYVVSSMFNSALFDFTEGWFYMLAVGVLGGLVLREQSRRSLPQALGDRAVEAPNLSRSRV
jgi:O-antigen ligase